LVGLLGSSGIARSIVEQFLTNSSAVCWNALHCWNLFHRWNWSHRSSHPQKAREKEVNRVKINIAEQTAPSASTSKSV
jgi:hypothetical protein